MKLYNLPFILIYFLSNGMILTSKESPDNLRVDLPTSKNARVPKLQSLDVSFLRCNLTQKDIALYKNHVELMNHADADIWQRKFWNLYFYEKKNHPIIVGSITDRKKFSLQYQDKGLRFLDLPIYMPGQGWRIPEELKQFEEVINMAVNHECLCLHDFEKDHYVYITVDQGFVEPHNSQRRPGFHADSYLKIDTTKSSFLPILVDHVYIAYDSCPTIFAEGPFDIKNNAYPEDVMTVLKYFEKTAINTNKYFYPDYTLLRVDPYCVHDAGINELDETIFRTFVKISFSKNKYAHLGNAHNNLFIYEWPLTLRKNVSYTKEAINQYKTNKLLFY